MGGHAVLACALGAAAVHRAALLPTEEAVSAPLFTKVRDNAFQAEVRWPLSIRVPQHPSFIFVKDAGPNIHLSSLWWTWGTSNVQPQLRR